MKIQRIGRPQQIRGGKCGLVCLLCCLLWGAAAHAHKASDGYLRLHAQGERIDGQWDIALRDLDHAIGLDHDDDGAVTWGELRARHTHIAAYALARLDLVADGAPCPMQAGEQLVDRHRDGAYAMLRFTAACPAPIRQLRVGYRLLFDLDAQHRGLLQLTASARSESAIFSRASPSRDFTLAAPQRWRQFADYFTSGVRHIWIGLDHVLFLIALLLPSVLRRREGCWEAVSSRAAVADIFKVVTAFTMAHSLTLGLAVFGLVHLPSRWVESAIAASVILAALNNLHPLLPERRWLVALVFGLIHGFGFASVLADLGLPPGGLALSLAGFNLGVEAGQLAIVALFLPLAFFMRRTAFYRRGVLALGSMAVASVALLWLLERSLDLRLLPSA